jgi:transposase
VVTKPLSTLRLVLSCEPSKGPVPMLTWENCVEAQALRTRGWSISAVANHLGHDRKTIRAYLNGERRPGERKPARAEAMEDFLDYCRQRLADDPHLWSTTLFDEVVELGFATQNPGTSL